MLTQYCSDNIRVSTPLDTSLVTNAVLTIRQGDVQVNLTEFTYPETEFGMFVASITGEQMALFIGGKADVQLRGFVDGEEFKTNICPVQIKPVLLKEVLTDD